jgi:RNA recognition motif-containing protein
MLDLESFQVYVGNLSPQVTDRRLFDYFKKHSDDVSNAHVIRDSSGMSWGYGFVKFEHDESAFKVVSRLNSAVTPAEPLDGNNLIVREAYRLTRSEINKGVDAKTGCTIFVGNLNLVMKDEDLRSAFTGFGIIASARVIQSKGFGFVTFMDHIAALAALSGMQNAEIFHQRIFCFWARQDQQEEAGTGKKEIGLDVDTSSHLIPQDVMHATTPENTVLDATERARLLRHALNGIELERDRGGPELPPSIRSRNQIFVESRIKQLFNSTISQEG